MQRARVVLGIVAICLFATTTFAEGEPCFRLRWADPETGASYAFRDCSHFPGWPSQEVLTLSGYAEIQVSAVDGLDGHWRLDVTNKKPDYIIKEIDFPYDAHRFFCETCDQGVCSNDPQQQCSSHEECESTIDCCAASDFYLNDSIDDDVILDPYVLGVANKLNSRRVWGWSAYEYPGPEFTPLLIRTDGQSAELIAATNWHETDTEAFEPRTVFASWACNGWRMFYKDLDLAEDESDTFLGMVVQSDPDLDPDEEPWVNVALKYRSWLRDRLEEEGLTVNGLPRYPDWITTNHGFIDIQLENVNDYNLGLDPTYFEEVWDEYKDQLPWTLFWGQMSPYPFDNPGCVVDSTEAPCGCCDECRALDPRYDNTSTEMIWDVRDFVSGVLDGYGDCGANGKCTGDASRDCTTTEDCRPFHAGFYTRPFCDWDKGSAERSCFKLDSDTCIPEELQYDPEVCPPLPFFTSDACLPGSGLETPEDWFLRWNEVSSTDWGGDSHYFDTLAGINWGAPLYIARMFQDGRLPMESISEWAMDVLPNAFLTTTSLNPATQHPGGPDHHWLSQVDNDDPNIAFPALGTLILSDRYFYTGPAGDWWGFCSDYWAERQAFLLGHKFDAHWPYERMSDCSAGGCAGGIQSCDVEAARPHCTSCSGNCLVRCENDAICVGTCDPVTSKCSNDPLKSCANDSECDFGTCTQKGYACITGGTWPPEVDCMDAALELAIAERDRVGWWDDKHYYMHREGLEELPLGSCVGGACSNDPSRVCSTDAQCVVDIRRFEIEGALPGENDVIVIDNWFALQDQTFVFDGVLVPVPTTRLAILEEATDLADTDGDGLADSLDNCPDDPNPDQNDCDGDGAGDVCDEYCVVTLYSTASEDGYLQRKVKNDSRTMYAGGYTLITGDDKAQGSQHGFRGFLSFETGTALAGLPANAVLTGASLTINSASQSGDPSVFTLYVDVMKGDFNGDSALEGADYDAALDCGDAGADCILDDSLVPLASGQKTFVFSAAELAWLQDAAGGRTQMRLRIVPEYDGDGSADSVNWYSGDAPVPPPPLEDVRPVLVITYTAPAP